MDSPHHHPKKKIPQHFDSALSSFVLPVSAGIASKHFIILLLLRASSRFSGHCAGRSHENPVHSDSGLKFSQHGRLRVHVEATIRPIDVLREIISHVLHNRTSHTAILSFFFFFNIKNLVSFISFNVGKSLIFYQHIQ